MQPAVVTITRADEGEAPQPHLLWDTVTVPSTMLGAPPRYDWALASPGEDLNRGGLQATETFDTAVLLCLFTDRRCPDDHPLRYLAGDDPRGWWGDGVDVRDEVGERPMGSLLWLLERAPASLDTERWAKSFAEDALAPLIGQGAAVRMEVDAKLNAGKGRIELRARLYARDGERLLDRQYETLWAGKA